MFITSRESAISPSALSSDITPHKAGDAFRHGPSRNLSSALLLFSRGGNLQCARYISVAGGGVKRLLPVSSGFLGLLRPCFVDEFGNSTQMLRLEVWYTTISSGIDVLASQFCLIGT